MTWPHSRRGHPLTPQDLFAGGFVLEPQEGVMAGTCGWPPRASDRPCKLRFLWVQSAASATPYRELPLPPAPDTSCRCP